MKIVFVLSGTILSGGATKSFLNLQGYLRSIGCEVLVVTPDKEGVFQKLQKDGIEVVQLDYGFNAYSINPIGLRKIKSVLSFIKNRICNYYAYKRLVTICKEFKPDIIHTNTSVNDIGYLTAKELGIPHVWHIREYGDIDFGFKVPRLYKMINSKDNYVICITKGIANHIKCYKNSNSTVIYNGIISENEDISEKREELHDKNYFLYAGRIERAKGVVDLIEAYYLYVKEFQSKDVLPLVLVGGIVDEVYFHELKDIIDRYSIAEFVHFKGEIPDINGYIKDAKAVIIPSYNEGFGRVAAESMALNTLVIGRNTAGTKEQFDNGLEITGSDIGLRFETIEDLSNILAEVSQSNVYRYNKMIKGAYNCVHELYSCNNYGRNVLSFYNKILNNQND